MYCLTDTIIYAPQTVNELRTIIKNHWNQLSNLFTGHVTFAFMNGTSIGEVLMKGHSIFKKLPYSPITSTIVPFDINSFHSPKERTCHKRACKACDVNFVLPPTQQSTDIVINGWSLHVPYVQSCQDQNFVYLIGCTRCPDLFYVGESSQLLVDRLYGHRSRTSDIYEHFTTNGHSLENAKMTVLSKMNRQCSNIERKGREYFYLKLLKPKLGLNKEFCPP